MPNVSPEYGKGHCTLGRECQDETCVKAGHPGVWPLVEKKQGTPPMEPFGYGELETIRDALKRDLRTYQGNLRRAIARTDIPAVKKWGLKVATVRGILHTINVTLNGWDSE